MGTSRSSATTEFGKAFACNKTAPGNSSDAAGGLTGQGAAPWKRSWCPGEKNKERGKCAFLAMNVNHMAGFFSKGLLMCQGKG